jgi:tight adherence protein C
MAVAIERGTPLADVLRAQAADVRALGKRQLLETGAARRSP